MTDHRDKMTMRAHQRAAFKRNALVASASKSAPPRDEEAIRAQNREDIKAHRAHGLLGFERSAPPMFAPTVKDPAKDPVCLGDFVDAGDGRVMQVMRIDGGIATAGHCGEWKFPVVPWPET